MAGKGLTERIARGRWPVGGGITAETCRVREKQPREDLGEDVLEEE